METWGGARAASAGSAPFYGSCGTEESGPGISWNGSEAKLEPMYKAIVLDLDGTLVNDDGRIPAGTLARLQAAAQNGVHVMVATGRSELATKDVLVELDVNTPALVYNGAALWCPRTHKLVEERLLSNRSVSQVLEFAESRDLAVVCMRAGAKFGTVAANDVEKAAMAGFKNLSVVGREDLPREFVIRITCFSGQHEDSESLQADCLSAVDGPIYTTHFPLSMLVQHRTSPMNVVDVQPPCRGKGEALRILKESFGIEAAEVVAVGDAMNDLPMLEEAGLSVAMEKSHPTVLRRADRVIGDNNTDTIGDLVDELFPLPIRR